MNLAPLSLDADGIAALIPHRGRMSLLDRLLGWDELEIRCVATNQARPDHPLRTARGLLAATGIEYAAQAMALHGGLLAAATAQPVPPGMLASARAVRLHRLRLDDLPGPLLLTARREAGDDRRILYSFCLAHAGHPIVEGRAAVLLDASTDPKTDR
jgi:predicted hotdog family 3-hydroxylacyl-ACP dehydratase